MIPNPTTANIVAAIREFAEALEKGAISRCVIIADADDKQIVGGTFGEGNELPVYLGMIELFKFQLIAQGRDEAERTIQ